MKKSKGEYSIQTVVNAMRLLESFRDEEELGVTELSRLLGLHKNNVFRLLATLEAQGYINPSLRASSSAGVLRGRSCCAARVNPGPRGDLKAAHLAARAAEVALDGAGERLVLTSPRVGAAPCRRQGADRLRIRERSRGL
jgi:hypothetical protein